jgi:hypothetical protein
MLRALIFTISFSSIAMMAVAEDRQHHRGHPEFTAEQKACLAKILGEPGKGERLGREKMDAAMSSCGIEKPKGPPSGGDGGEKPQQENSQDQQK